MRNMINTPKTIIGALEELGAELGISAADFGGIIINLHYFMRKGKKQ